MKSTFFDELPANISIALSGETPETYALYVRLMRRVLHIDRKELARRAGLERVVISKLETGFLRKSELTSEVRGKIEEALEVPYCTFVQANAEPLDTLRRDWGWGTRTQGQARPTQDHIIQKSNCTKPQITVQ